MVQLSHPYMTSEKNIALTRWTFVGKVISLLFNTLSRFVIAFLPRSRSLLISWLHEIKRIIKWVATSYSKPHITYVVILGAT